MYVTKFPSLDPEFFFFLSMVYQKSGLWETKPDTMLSGGGGGGDSWLLLGQAVLSARR